MATLTRFFGKHTGDLKIYVSHFPIGAGTFQHLSNFETRFSGSYTIFFHTQPLRLMIKLSNQDASAVSGACEVSVNDQLDQSATYDATGETITFTTRLAQTRVAVYRSEGGTQIDGLNGHNAWIG